MPSPQGAFQPPNPGAPGAFQGSQPMMMFDPAKFQNLAPAAPNFQQPQTQPQTQPQSQAQDQNQGQNQGYAGGFQGQAQYQGHQQGHVNDSQNIGAGGFQNDQLQQQQNYDYYNQYNQQNQVNQEQQQGNEPNRMYNYWDGYNYNYVSKV